MVCGEGGNDWDRNVGEAGEVCIQQLSLPLALLLPESWGEGQRRGKSTKIFLSCLSGRKRDTGACNTSAASFSPWETTWLEKGF